MGRDTSWPEVDFITVYGIRFASRYLNYSAILYKQFFNI